MGARAAAALVALLTSAVLLFSVKRAWKAREGSCDNPAAYGLLVADGRLLCRVSRARCALNRSAQLLRQLRTCKGTSTEIERLRSIVITLTRDICLQWVHQQCEGLVHVGCRAWPCRP